MYNYKIGDIIVITQEYGKVLPGQMWMIRSKQCDGCWYLNTDHPCAPYEERIRLASRAEEQAYWAGIRHIEDVKKPEVTNEYQIY